MKKIKVTFNFPSDSIQNPLTYYLVKDFNLKINILHADISLNRTGRLVMDISGKADDVKAALEYVKDQGIDFKIFDKQVIWNEEKCVHCGACTSVCPSGALSMNKENWHLEFDKEKCLVCELCIKTCPLGVMKIQY